MVDKEFEPKRRNLMVTTFVMLFIQYADAEVQSVTAASTARIVINNPDAVLNALWALWIYFFVRAYQYYRTYMRPVYEKGIQAILAPALHPLFSGYGIPEEKEKILFETLERFNRYEIAFRLLGSWTLDEPRGNGKTRIRRGYRTRRIRRRLTQRARIQNREPQASTFSGAPHLSLNLLAITFHKSWWNRMSIGYPWHVRVFSISDKPADGIALDTTAEMRLTFLQGLGLQLKILRKLLQSSLFFEYRFPFVFALAPILVYLYEPAVDLMKRFS